MSKQPWYTIQARKVSGVPTVEIRIHDEIGGGGVTFKSFLEDLDRATPNSASILLSINSPGGDVFDAFAIYNALARYSGKITGRVDGLAASAASLILMAAHRIVMPENSMIMIHNPAAVTGGEADDLRRLADMIDKMRSSFIKVYAKRSGQQEAEVERMMDETTWMDAFEAQRLGFCDEIEDPVRLVAVERHVAVLAKYRRVPDTLMASMRRAANKPERPSSTETPESLVKFIYDECRAQGIPGLAETVVVGAVDGTRAQTTARVEHAVQVAGLCLAAKRPALATDFIKAGLGVEQIRARLFDMVVSEYEATAISNIQRPEPSAEERRQGAMQEVAVKVYR